MITINGNTLIIDGVIKVCKGFEKVSLDPKSREGDS